MFRIHDKEGNVVRGEDRDFGAGICNKVLIRPNTPADAVNRAAILGRSIQ